MQCDVLVKGINEADNPFMKAEIEDILFWRALINGAEAPYI